MGGATSPDHGPEHDLELELVREAVTMALYVGISLLAVMVSLPADLITDPVSTIVFTSIGLMLAHVVAYRLSTRLVHQRAVIGHHARLLTAQLIGGLSVTALAVTPVLLSPTAGGLRASELILLAFVAVTGYVAARATPVSRIRALIYVAGIVASVLGILWIESLVVH